ncbi:MULTISPECIES: class I SAM-dependent methyltransferase [Kordiimonas]|jgi:ubiquinone/menaquinone biosynthesis C-methylase UbiE|uniref:class I SAM-dependent methyltransferase n=1 Tax=Kordiimonas TaxID=288021 RepID=UPI00257ED3F3|nr:class I SAM-dependent methyltransferase [Kordiimonas sp. UBA4487]
MQQDAKFWNRMAKGYAKSKISDMPSYERKLEVTRGYFTPDMEVLEIGCGTGTTALRHAPHVKHIRATDISQEMIAIAQAKADAEGIRNVSFEVSAIDDLKVEDASLDMVMAHSILHLVPNRREVIKQVYRMLKPGGLFVTSTVCLKDGMGWLKPILPLMRLVGYAPRVVAFITANQLEADFTDAGFDVAYKWRPGPKKAIFMVLRKPE